MGLVFMDLWFIHNHGINRHGQIRRRAITACVRCCYGHQRLPDWEEEVRGDANTEPAAGVGGRVLPGPVACGDGVRDTVRAGGQQCYVIGANGWRQRVLHGYIHGIGGGTAFAVVNR